MALTGCGWVCQAVPIATRGGGGRGRGRREPELHPTGPATYRAKVRRCLDVFALMLAEAKFDFERPLTGLEIELNLIDAEQDPAMRNAEVLAMIANDDFHTESCHGGPGWRTSSDLGLILLGKGASRPRHPCVIASQRQNRDADVGAMGRQLARKIRLSSFR